MTLEDFIEECQEIMNVKHVSTTFWASLTASEKLFFKELAVVIINSAISHGKVYLVFGLTGQGNSRL